MCLILFAHRYHPDYPLVLAANRDEYYARPSASASFWPEAPRLLAGRDLVGGGSWLGITRAGRWGAITNYRHPAEFSRHGRSRGLLVRDYLLGDTPPLAFVEELAAGADPYPGYNLLAGEGEELAWFSNRGGAPRRLPAGIYGLSNHLLDTPWPKVAGGKRALAALLAAPSPDPEALFALLADSSPAADALLSDTGIGPERERQLSPRFIRTPGYGTRCSTVLLIDRERQVTFIERNFNGTPLPQAQKHYRFTLEAGA